MGGKQDGSREGLGACPPNENFELRFSQIAFKAIWD